MVAYAMMASKTVQIRCVVALVSQIYSLVISEVWLALNLLQYIITQNMKCKKSIAKQKNDQDSW